MVGTAAAVLAAPPSILPELMAGLGIDPKVLGDTPMPSDHANPPSAKLLLAQALAEQEKLAAPKQTPAQAALEAAEQKLAEADIALEEARKASNRARYKLRKALKAAAEADPENPLAGGSTADPAASSEVTAAQTTLEQAKQGHLDAVKRAAAAREDVAAAKFGLAEDMDPADRDAYYASLSEDDVSMIVSSVNRQYTEEAASALQAGGEPGLAGLPRDTSVYKHAEIPMETGSGVAVVEGRKLDGGTAIYRRGYGDFVVLQRKGDAWFPVTTASGKSEALAKANRIPIMRELGELPADATDMQRQAHAIKADLLLEVATQAANGTASSTQAQRAIIDDGMAGAATKLADSVGGGVVQADIYDGVKRHKRALLEKAAHEAGVKARTAALASGATKAQAEAAYAKARRQTLGTPTRGGGVIPHFDHKVPPDSLGSEKHASLTRSGIRAWGAETTNDYAIIAKRAGDLQAWGFTDSSGQIQASSIQALTSKYEKFVKETLTKSERGALTTYTGGSYMEINAAITGRTKTPTPQIKSVVSRLEQAFDTFGQKNPNMDPMTVMRGSRVPSGWKGTPAEYLEAAFKPGARVEMGKVTSCSTEQHVATGFAKHPPYIMVIRTRDGLPVKSISSYSSENEVIVPPGSFLRCVRVDEHGVGGYPTVYLVAEDLVAEQEDAGFAAAA